MATIINGRTLLYGPINWIKKLARLSKKNYYTFAVEEICGQEIQVLLEVIGDSSKLYTRVALGKIDDDHTRVCITKKVNLIEIAMKFGPINDVDNFMDRFTRVVFLLKKYHLQVYQEKRPKYPNGRSVSFQTYLEERLVIIEDPLNEAVKGIYGSMYSAAMMFLMFGSRNDLLQFREYLGQQFGSVLFERHFSAFFDQLESTYDTFQ
ncbi:MAG: hypothetical protein IKA36_03810 [Clostridia bacterium]|nr:hypothetical protein [Clostridia bacterium]